MKNFIIWFGLFLFVIIPGCTASKDLQKAEKAANEAALREAIANRSFVVEVNRALPMNMSSRMLNSSYTLTVNGNSMKSHLPYFGRAYSVAYGGGEGLIFDAVILDYELSLDKKGKALITFNAESKEDRFAFRIHILPNGSSSIEVTSMNRQPISFNGKAFLLSKEK